MKIGGILVEESSFSVLYTKNIKEEIEKRWASAAEFLEGHGIKGELDAPGRTMTVRTTDRASDPCSILFARDMIKLLSRSVPLKIARRVFDENTASEVLQIRDLVRDQDVFLKRRRRLVGSKGETLKTVQTVTGCHLAVEGNTVAIVGPFQGVKEARKLATDCMKNIHPVYQIKELMIRHELAKDESLKGESWERFIPKYKKTSVRRKKPEIKKKERAVFPVAPPKSKLDMMMESGEYFLKKKQNKKERNKKTDK